MAMAMAVAMAMEQFKNSNVENDKETK